MQVATLTRLKESIFGIIRYEMSYLGLVIFASNKPVFFHGLKIKHRPLFEQHHYYIIYNCDAMDITYYLLEVIAI